MREIGSASYCAPLFLLIAVILVAPTLIFGPAGLPRLNALQRELDRVRAKNEYIRREVESLRDDTERLRNDPRAVERIARDELGMVREGEIVFQFPN